MMAAKKTTSQITRQTIQYNHGKKYAKQMEMEIENKPANTKDGGGEKI